MESPSVGNFVGKKKYKREGLGNRKGRGGMESVCPMVEKRDKKTVVGGNSGEIQGDAAIKVFYSCWGKKRTPELN